MPCEAFFLRYCSKHKKNGDVGLTGAKKINFDG